MVEIDQEYCLYAQKRLKMALENPAIQGYYDGVFWERNTLNKSRNDGKRKRTSGNINSSAKKCVYVL